MQRVSQARYDRGLQEEKHIPFITIELELMLLKVNF